MRILITGASGVLGAALLRELRGRGLGVEAWSGPHATASGVRPVDLADGAAVADAFRAARPAAVIHAAARARVGDCHRDPDGAFRVNVGGTATLAGLAAASAARLVLVSTDLVFDGERGGYREEDPPSPASVYGRSKRAAEGAALVAPCSAVVRLSLLYGPGPPGRPSFFDEQAAALRGGARVTLFADEWRTPLDLATAARALAEVALSEVCGVLHVGGPERMSRLETGRRLAAYLGVVPTGLVAGARADAPAPEPRPRDTSLDSSRWRQLFPGLPWPRFEDALPGMGV
jgi:dTDP-4-dehydrorhamnose reductase